MFLCYVLKRCVTEASALLAGVFTMFCSVYDRGGCALPRPLRGALGGWRAYHLLCSMHLCRVFSWRGFLLCHAV